VYTPEMVADAMIRCAEHGTREVIVGGAGKMMAAQWVLAPRLAERFLSAQANRDHFVKDQPAPHTSGTLFEPMAAGTDTTGGWGGSRGPDVLAGVGAAGLALLAPAMALLASGRFRTWVGEHTRLRRPTPMQRRMRSVSRTVRSLVGT
jgi:hypothetical protein